MQKIHPEALEAMQSRGGTWAAYENQAMDSVNAGHLQFLKVGPGCTHETPPPHYHDTLHGLGWKYRYIGMVDLEEKKITGATQDLNR